MNEISSEKREEIRKQAKQIIDNFASALSKAKISAKKEKDSLGGFRTEGNGQKGNADFRKRMFANAPHKNEDNIIAETKKW